MICLALRVKKPTKKIRPFVFWEKLADHSLLLRLTDQNLHFTACKALIYTSGNREILPQFSHKIIAQPFSSFNQLASTWPSRSTDLNLPFIQKWKLIVAKIVAQHFLFIQKFPCASCHILSKLNTHTKQ